MRQTADFTYRLLDVDFNVSNNAINKPPVMTIIGGIDHSQSWPVCDIASPTVRVSLAVGIAADAVYELVAMGPLGRPTAPAKIQ